MHHTASYEDRSVWKGAVAGLDAGMVASWVMNQFQAGLSKVSQSISGNGQHTRDQSEQQGDGEDATIKAAETILERVAGRSLTKEQKQTAGPVIHYTFGSSVGAAYGALAELEPSTTKVWGLPFGAAVWLGADEIAVPALGFSKIPLDYPVSTHASALAAHLVYGITTDVVWRAIRAAC